MQTRIFSGIQPTGALHLGNYLGAIKNWVAMQNEMESIYCIVDLHAITMKHDPAQLRADTRSMAAALLACGIDPANSILFNQSMVRAHTELAWTLSCVARMGWLSRMTQFKDKAGKNREQVSVGLFTYPVLMAADILLYKATHVPVGDDQKQHLELARDIAQKFNLDFGSELFPLPEPIIPRETARVMSLRDGTAKMSKSDPSDMSRINLTDTADTISLKIQKARTDPGALPATEAELEGRPEARNLIGIYASITGSTIQAVLDQFSGQGFGAFKPTLAAALNDHLGPIATRLREFEANPEQIDQLLRKGAEQAAQIADPIMAQVKDVVGFLV
ncbi:MULTISPECIES: tryptophan--tRNA ligase [unclassified Sphingomonas]|uniref:tryptophan--tRNA ligase n=1 Tax=unclassified Sphingomonas TaxID=196159 RepID=UPI0006F36D23|nr:MULTISPECIES: tryptophan--tRNA ligase [unclassified Sphingomonas]KQX18565.1 tryptophan--tRNA ligase [Sphingomonas sp. Root1294]KQY72111.1 tryptophan--tRNA ligase [Sphingomonas sp. Root50]KRB94619.1 tryptophan--tRNA ligase [Sphingomonas sp. Root720]